MNTGSTMRRVYGTLKSQIMAGQFAPGERLDPVRLASGLASSATPVRDALHRLVGERLVENFQNDGFRQPLISEPAIRDLYEWLHQLSLVAVASARSSRPAAPKPDAPVPADYLELVVRVFTSLAEMSDNKEHLAVMANLLDRTHLFHRAEARFLEGAYADLQILSSAIASRSWHDVKILLNRHYRRRRHIITNIANQLRQY